MKFMMSFSWPPETQRRATAIERFSKNAGKMPKGVRLLGRWTHADLHGGYDLLETDDPKALTEFAYLWSDLMTIRITPVLDDAELGAALEAAMQPR